MGKLAFYIVDVFAEKKYAGNQLAVFRDAEALSTDEMQHIAREMNFSETTYEQVIEMMKLVALQRHGLLTSDHMQHLSEETQKRLKALKGL